MAVCALISRRQRPDQISLCLLASLICACWRCLGCRLISMPWPPKTKWGSSCRIWLWPHRLQSDASAVPACSPPMLPTALLRGSHDGAIRWARGLVGHLAHNVPTRIPLQLVLDIVSRSGGLGVPGRRYSLGGIIGAFRFLSRVNLQPYIFVALTNTPSSVIAEEFFLIDAAR